MTLETDLTPSDIREIRSRLGLSLTEFAYMLGVSASAVLKWESGERTPRGAAVKLLRQAERRARRKETATA